MLRSPGTLSENRTSGPFIEDLFSSSGNCFPVFQFRQLFSSRPIALTSLVMKSFEKLIKRELTFRTNCLLDPLQFAYRLNREVQDATVTVLNLILNHIEGNRNHARLLFVDFSSAFNTIQLHLLAEKLVHQFKLEATIVGWILDFLTNRSQRVRVNDHLSDLTLTSTGSPQGCAK